VCRVLCVVSSVARRDPRYNSESPNPLLAAIVAGHTEVVECFFHQFTDAGTACAPFFTRPPA
jgi:hypothetical protein